MSGSSMGIRRLSEPLDAGFLLKHMLQPSHDFGYQEIEGQTTGRWGSLWALHRGDHEGRDQDHIHEI